MNVVFDKKTLRVVYTFDNKLIIKSETDILKTIFPTNYYDLSLWEIDKKINHNILYLKVELDDNDCPQRLLYKGKEIYKISEELVRIRNKNKKRIITIDGINLKKELSDFLISSPYTKSETIKDFLNGTVPYQDPISVIWRGHFKISTGYSAIGRNVLFRLHNYGIFAKPEYLPSHSDIDPLYAFYLNKYDSLKFSRLCRGQVKVLSHTPLPDNFFGRKIIYTMMETETLHPDFVNMCNRYNEVWVPCKHNYSLFVNHGVKVPVYVIPLGVDERFYFGNNESTVNMKNGLVPLLGNGLKKFKFISLFQWYSRKCPNVLIKSFVRAFNEQDDVCLIIANHYGDLGSISNEVMHYAKSERQTNFPSIFLYNQIPTDRQLPSLYKSCDAFISTSMGEGFSLPPVEAAACGLPVIAAHHTAMKDYLNENNSYLVRVAKKGICPPELAVACGWYNGQLFNILGDDEISQFSDKMKTVVNNYDDALIKAKRLQDMVKNNYTWDITTSLVARRIRER